MLEEIKSVSSPQQPADCGRGAGLKGLANLGNTCYMNSALQLLSQVVPLTNFALKETLAEEGSDTEKPLMKAYAELMKTIWSEGGESTCESLRNLNQAVETIVKSFQPGQQHDAEELLSNVLDRLHQELKCDDPEDNKNSNDNKAKEEEEEKQKHAGRAREKSIIQNLFRVSICDSIECSGCRQIKKTHDEGRILHLAHQARGQYKQDAFWVPLDPDEVPTLHQLEVREQGNVEELCTAMLNKVGKPGCPMDVHEIFAHKFYRNVDTNEMLSSILPRDDIYIFEYPNSAEEPIVMTPVLHREGPSSEEPKLFGQPFLLPVNKRDYDNPKLMELLLKHMKRYLKLPTQDEEAEGDGGRSGTRGDPTEPGPESLEEEEEEEEEEEGAKEPAEERGTVEESARARKRSDSMEVEGPEDTYLGDLSEEDVAMRFGKDEKNSEGSAIGEQPKGAREEGDEDRDSGAEIFDEPMEDTETPREAKRDEVPSGEFFKISASNAKGQDIMGVSLENATCLTLEWTQETRGFYDEVAAERFIQYHLPRNRNVEPTTQPTLEKMLEMFASVEQLQGSNMYDCEVCKGKKAAFKRTQISRLPPYLIIQFKSRPTLGALKNEQLVRFPISDLDMSDYMEDFGGREAEEGNTVLYDLVAVINHVGSMVGGHYTALAKHKLNNRWWCFDDARVTPIEDDEIDKQIITEKAYLLLYERKNSVKPQELQEAIKAVGDSQKAKRFSHTEKARRDWRDEKNELDRGNLSPIEEMI